MGGPVFLKVPVGDFTEVALMGAMDYIVQHFHTSAMPRPLDFAEIQRAVDWLHAKYGTEGGDGR